MEYVLLSIAVGWSGIQFGTLWIMQTSIMPLLNGLPKERYVDTCQRIDMHLFHPIAVAGGLSVAAVGAVLAVVLDDPTSRVTAGVAAVMMLAVGLISEGKNRPIWRMIEKWQPATMPANWDQLRTTWKNAHALRTAAAFLAVALFVVAAAAEFGRLS